MKNREEVEKWLYISVEKRRLQWAETLKNQAPIDPITDGPMVERISVLCEILGDVIYDPYLHKLTAIERHDKEPEHLKPGR